MKICPRRYNQSNRTINMNHRQRPWQPYSHRPFWQIDKSNCRGCLPLTMRSRWERVGPDRRRRSWLISAWRRRTSLWRKALTNIREALLTCRAPLKLILLLGLGALVHKTLNWTTIWKRIWQILIKKIHFKAAFSNCRRSWTHITKVHSKVLLIFPLCRKSWGRHWQLKENRARHQEIEKDHLKEGMEVWVSLPRMRNQMNWPSSKTKRDLKVRKEVQSKKSNLRTWAPKSSNRG